MDQKLDPVEGAIQTQADLEAAVGKLGKERATALLLRDLTRQPGWPYLKEIGDALVDQYEGHGLPRTEAEGYRYAMAGPIRKALKMVWALAERFGGEPRDEAEAVILRDILNGTAITTKEVENL